MSAIETNDPQALARLSEKIKSLEASRDLWKRLNAMVRKCNGSIDTLAAMIACATPAIEPYNGPVELAKSLLTPDFAGRTGIPSYQITNIGAEIRRLKARLPEVKAYQQGPDFEAFEVNGIEVSVLDGRVQVVFPGKPEQSVIDRLKRSPLALKWSPSRAAWVRKESPATRSDRFLNALKEVLS